MRAIQVEGKCDDLNKPQRRAVQRFGFIYEDTFRDATDYRDRDRDTAWSAIIAGDRHEIAAALEPRLDPDNLDSAGNGSGGSPTNRTGPAAADSPSGAGGPSALVETGILADHRGGRSS